MDFGGVSGTSTKVDVNGTAFSKILRKRKDPGTRLRRRQQSRGLHQLQLGIQVGNYLSHTIDIILLPRPSHTSKSAQFNSRSFFVVSKRSQIKRHDRVFVENNTLSISSYRHTLTLFKKEKTCTVFVSSHGNKGGSLGKRQM